VCVNGHSNIKISLEAHSFTDVFVHVVLPQCLILSFHHAEEMSVRLSYSMRLEICDYIKHKITALSTSFHAK
jgi:hypothetical protein